MAPFEPVAEEMAMVAMVGSTSFHRNSLKSTESSPGPAHTLFSYHCHDEVGESQTEVLCTSGAGKGMTDIGADSGGITGKRLISQR